MHRADRAVLIAARAKVYSEMYLIRYILCVFASYDTRLGIILRVGSRVKPRAGARCAHFAFAGEGLFCNKLACKRRRKLIVAKGYLPNHFMRRWPDVSGVFKPRAHP